MTTTDLAARVQALEDQAAISELRSRYNDCLDHLDLDGFVDLWTDDAHIEDGPVTLDGVAQIREMNARAAEFIQEGWHTVSNEQTHLDGDRASGSCYFHALLLLNDEPFVGTGKYAEKFARGTDGRWRFAERVVTIFHHYPVAEFIRGGSPVFRE